MVQLKSDSIVITLENVSPVEDWQDLLLTLADVTSLLMSNTDFLVSGYNMTKFSELYKASCTLSKDSVTMEILAKYAANKHEINEVRAYQKTLEVLRNDLLGGKCSINE
jgi:hypothetical protein